MEYSVVSSWYERNKVNASSKFIYDSLEILLFSETFAIRHWKTASSPRKFFKWLAFLDDSKSNIFQCAHSRYLHFPLNYTTVKRQHIFVVCWFWTNLTSHHIFWHPAYFSIFWTWNIEFISLPIAAKSHVSKRCERRSPVQRYFSLLNALVWKL